MKILRLLISISLLFVFIYIISIRLSVGNNKVPPFGKFLNPWHGYLQNSESQNTSYTEAFSLEGLKEEVSISYDENMIPHIYAKNNKDLYFAQGYIVAQFRLWQMEFQTMAAGGRLSEIIGEAALDFDRKNRRYGLKKGAENTMALMEDNPELIAWVESYANGVNAYIDQLTYKDLPIEYKILNYFPEKWTTIKTAYILEYMINNLSGWDNDLENTNAVSLFGKETVDLLFPDYLEGIDPVITRDKWDFDPLVVATPDKSITDDEIISATVESSDPRNGSNNWAVSGEKTLSGNPILANDPHLGLNLPSLWIAMHLNSPDMNVTGFTFPGALGITIGLNDSIAWGFTNAPRDQRDWYSVKFKDETKTEYWYDSSWHPVSLLIEEIKIRDQKSFFDTIRYTHHGPVVYDNNYMAEDEKYNLAMKWIAHEPSRVQIALNKLNRSKNFKDYADALQYWDAPSQNVVFASTQGDIALTVAGHFPLKYKEQGKFLLDGSLKEDDWQGYIPYEHRVYSLNPERGFVSSANQHSVSENYPYYTYSGTLEFYRNRRINRLLSEMDSITVGDFMKMHLDSYSIEAEEVLPIFLSAIKTKNYSGVAIDWLKQLNQWDYTYSSTSELPSVFERWWWEFKNILWDEFKNKDVALDFPSSYSTYIFIKNHPHHVLMDNKKTVQTDSLSDLVNMAFDSTIHYFEQLKSNNQEYTWKEYNNVKINHLARIPQFSTNKLSTSGSGSSINAVDGSHGPSLRLIVEMSTPPKAYGIYPGGQSGNPGSPFYENFVESWVQGDYFDLVLDDKEKIKSKATFTQILKPLSK